MIGAATILTLGLGLVASGGLPSDPTIEVLDRGKGVYRLTLTATGTSDVSVGQQLLGPTASRLCRDKYPAFGKYTFHADESIAKPAAAGSTRLVLTQEIACAADAPSTPSASPVPPRQARRPNPRDQAAAVGVFTKYLSGKDSGDYPRSYGLLSQSMKDAISAENWQNASRHFNTLAGRVISREVRRITWYDNPPSAPKAGVYVAIDYSSAYRNVDLHCGYVILYLVTPGSFEVAREEVGYLDRETAKSIPAADLPAWAEKLGCVPKSPD